MKDELENRLHDLVCTEHTITLRAVQKAIAKNWETLYKKVNYGTITVNAIWSESAAGLSVNVFTSSWLAPQLGPAVG